jgi:hypothetical protein
MAALGAVFTQELGVDAILEIMQVIHKKSL